MRILNKVLILLLLCSSVSGQIGRPPFSSANVASDSFIIADFVHFWENNSNDNSGNGRHASYRVRGL